MWPTAQHIAASYAWANRPAAASSTGIVIRVSDIGGTTGSLWISNGVYWVPYTGSVILARSSVADSISTTTAEEAFDGATITIPALAMGANGRLRVTMSFTVNNNANNKNIYLRLGGLAGTAYWNVNMASTLTGRFIPEISNRGATNSQTAGTALGNGNYGTNSNAITTGAVDTSVNTTLVISGKKGTDTDTITLESFLVELINI